MDVNIRNALGDTADYYLGFNAPKISKERLHLPGPDFVDRIFAPSDRNNRVLSNLQRLFRTGRLAGTGYMSVLPVDQGIEHSAGASFAKNPDYFDAENIVKLADATPSLRLSACSGWSPAGTRTRSRSS
jgi:class I fructose-bisphosphate aldolase